MRTSVSLAAMALVAAAFAGAQQPTANVPRLDQMIGQWVLHGEIAGRATTHDVNCQRVLGHE